MTIISGGGGAITERNDLNPLGAPDIGGKAWNLFRLHECGFPVPSWYVVPCRLFDQAVGAQTDAIQKCLDDIDFTDQLSVNQAARRISDIIISADFPAQLIQEILTTLGEKFKANELFSVRSSAADEDSAEHSFAGQMDSFLNVRLSNIPDTIKKVWASAFSPRALVYRRKKNISFDSISTGVIIQEMVHSVSSGILFTREPESRAKKCVISAGYGLGEGVVSDAVLTDSYRIDWDSSEISKEIACKDYRVVNNPEGEGNLTERVPSELQLEQVLNDSQIRFLRDTGVKAEGCFGGVPLDIEWAFDEQGRLFLLQARPIIFGSQKSSSPARLRIWENSNIVESYPGLTLPLTFSLAREGYEIAFRNATLSFLFFKRPVRERLHIFRNMIGLLDGRIYYNLLNWYEMLSLLPGFKAHKKSWDQMIGISQNLEFPEHKLSPINNFLSLLIMAWKLLTVRGNARRFQTRFLSLYHRYQNLDASGASEDELIAIYESIQEQFTDHWHLTLVNDFCAMKYYDWLKRLCERWLPEEDAGAQLHHDLLCGEKGVESVAPVRSLAQLAETVRAEPAYQTLFNENDNQAIIKKIETDATFSSLKDALETHLQAFGDRALQELKLETPTLREQPHLLIGQIKDYLRVNVSGEAMENREREIRRSAEARIRRHLRNPFKRLIFGFVLRNSRFSIAARENMRFARCRLFGIGRRLFRRMADLFAEKGLLASASDIHYLSVEEVFDTVQGAAVTRNLQSLVELRKSEYAGFTERAPKERIETKGIPYLETAFEGGTGDSSISSSKGALKGIGCSSGVARGRAKVVYDPAETRLDGDEILVARSTDPAWVFLMVSAKGIVVERGSVLSHTAIIGRELGIPTVVGVRDATKLITDGSAISIDGGSGEVRWE